MRSWPKSRLVGARSRGRRGPRRMRRWRARRDVGAARLGHRPVVGDTDMSTDDVLALRYLLGRRDVDVRAVAVSGTGIADCPAGARNAQALCLRGPWRRAGGLRAPGPGGRRQRVPAGMARARRRAVRPEAAGGAERGSATPLTALRRGIESADGKVTVLSLAPMTDTALLLRSARDLRDWIASIVATGGAGRRPGNIGLGHERSEWNLALDRPGRGARGPGQRDLDHLVGLDARTTCRRPSTSRTCSIVTTPAPARPRVEAHGVERHVRRAGPVPLDPPPRRRGPPRRLTLARKPVSVVTAGADAGRLVEDPRGAPVRLALGAERAVRAQRVPGGADRTDQFAIPAPSGARSCAAPPAAARTGTATNRAGPGDLRHRQRRLAPVHPPDRSPPRSEDGGRSAPLRRRRGRADFFRPPVWLSTVVTGQTPPRQHDDVAIGATAGDYVLIATTRTRPEPGWSPGSQSAPSAESVHPGDLEAARVLTSWRNGHDGSSIVDGRLRELHAPLVRDADVTLEPRLPMRTAHGSYRRSLAFLVVTAASEVFPEADVIVEHSAPTVGGYFCAVSDSDPFSVEELRTLEARMREIVERDEPIVKAGVPVTQAVQLFQDRGESDKARLIAQSA